jgi:hypothetical protein
MAENISFQLDIDSGNAPNTLKDLNAQIDHLKEQLEGKPIGSKEFKQLSAQLQDANSKAKDLEKSFEGLESTKVVESFAKLGSGIVEGFAGASSALQLFGAENKEVEEILVKSQQAVSIAMAARGISEAIVEGAVARRIITEKLSTATTWLSTQAQAAYNLVVGASTGALKLFRLALVSTGLGAVVVGLGLLIANWEKFTQIVKDNSAKIQEYGILILKLINPYGQIVLLIELLGRKFNFVQQIIDKVTERIGILFASIKESLIAIGVLDTAEQNAKEAATEAAEKRLEELDVLRKERERQIALAKAEGASAKELRNLEIEMIRERTEAYIDFTKKKIAEGEKLSQDEKDKLNDSTNELKIKLLEDARLTKQENEKAQKEQEDKYKKALEDQKKAADEAKRKKEEELKAIAELEKQLQDERTKNIEDERARELIQTQTDFQRRLAEIKGNSDLEIELKKEILQSERNAIEELKAKYAEEDAQKEKEKLEKEYTDSQAKLEADLINLELTNQATQEKQIEIENARFEHEKQTKQLSAGELELLEANHKQNLAAIDQAAAEQKIKTEQDIKAAQLGAMQSTIDAVSQIGGFLTTNAKKNENFQKQIALVQLGVDSAKSIAATIAGATQAAATGGPAAPFLLAGYIASGIATVFGAMNQARKLLGASASNASGGGGASAPSASFSAPSKGVTAPVPTQSNVESTKIRGQQNNEPQTIKAIVVESDVTDTQNRVKRINTAAEF